MDFIKGFKSGIWLKKAKEYFSNPAKIKTLLDNVMRYAKKDNLSKVKDELTLLYKFVGDVCGGKYRNYDVSSVFLILAALIYLVSPADIVPDFIPLAGLIDDASIVAWVFNEVKEELDKYRDSLDGKA